MTTANIVIHHGATVTFVPDATVEKGTLLIHQCSDTSGNRINAYEVRHYPIQHVVDRIAMMRRIKELVR